MSNSELKPYKDLKGNLRWPIFIPKSFCKKIRNKQGDYFYIVSFVHEGTRKEAFIPFAFLKEHVTGKGYYGHIQVDLELTGRKMVSTKVNSSDFLKFFPPAKMPKTRKK